MKPIETTLEVWNSLHAQVRAGQTLAATLRKALRAAPNYTTQLAVDIEAGLDKYERSITAVITTTATTEDPHKTVARKLYGGRMLNYIVQSNVSELERAAAIFVNARRIGKTRLTQAIFDEMVDKEVSMLLALGPLQRKCLRIPLNVDASLDAEWTTKIPVAEVEDVCACCCDACEIGEHCYTKNVCFDKPSL